MLTISPDTPYEYRIRVYQFTSRFEMVADLEGVQDLPPGCVVFDFDNYAAGDAPRRRIRELPANTPANQGFWPVENVLDQLAIIAAWHKRGNPHRTLVALPDPGPIAGRRFEHMEIANWLTSRNIPVRRLSSAETVLETERSQWLPVRDVPAPNASTSLKFPPNWGDPGGNASDAFELLIETVGGGMVSGLYLPDVGYMELCALGWSGTQPSQCSEAHLDVLYRCLDWPAMQRLGNLAMVQGGAVSLRYGKAVLSLLPDGSVEEEENHFGFPEDRLPHGLGCMVILQLSPTE